MQCCAAGHQAPHTQFFWRKIFHERGGGGGRKKRALTCACRRAHARETTSAHSNALSIDASTHAAAVVYWEDGQRGAWTYLKFEALQAD